MNSNELIELSNRLNNAFDRGVSNIDRLLNIINNFEGDFNVDQFGLFCAFNNYHSIFDVLVYKDLNINMPFNGRRLFSIALEAYERPPTSLIMVRLEEPAANTHVESLRARDMDNQENIFNYHRG